SYGSNCYERPSDGSTLVLAQLTRQQQADSRAQHSASARYQGDFRQCEFPLFHRFLLSFRTVNKAAGVRYDVLVTDRNARHPITNDQRLPPQDSVASIFLIGAAFPPAPLVVVQCLCPWLRPTECFSLFTCAAMSGSSRCD